MKKKHMSPEKQIKFWEQGNKNWHQWNPYTPNSKEHFLWERGSEMVPIKVFTSKGHFIHPKNRAP